MNMTVDASVFFRFLIAALATWRVAFLLARERGPWNIFGRLRRRVGGVAELVGCVKCVGLWIAMPFALFVRGDWLELVVTWLALAGVAALIDEWTRPPFEWQPTEPDRASRSGEAGARVDDREWAR
jgi:hypothetical protein